VAKVERPDGLCSIACVAMLAVFVGPLVVRANVRQQTEVTASAQHGLAVEAEHPLEQGH
jgi:hypothetical protein